MAYSHLVERLLVTNVGRISPSLQAFVDAVHGAVKGVKFIPGSYTDVHVYFDGQPYTAGILSHGVYSGNTATYGVTTDSIKNSKFSSGTRQHHMVMSKNIATAVKNAKTHLRPAAIDTQARLSMSALTNAVSDTLTRGYREQQAIANIWNADRGSPLFTEMRNLLNSDYKFVNRDLGEKLARWFDLSDSNYAIEHTAKTFVYVLVGEDYRGQVLKMQRTTPGVGARLRGLTIANIPAISMPVGNVNEEITGRLSVLSMLESDKYVEGVGYRLGSHTFLIEFDGPFETPIDADGDAHATTGTA